MDVRARRAMGADAYPDDGLRGGERVASGARERADGDRPPAHDRLRGGALGTALPARCQADRGALPAGGQLRLPALSAVALGAAPRAASQGDSEGRIRPPSCFGLSYDAQSRTVRE